MFPPASLPQYDVFEIGSSCYTRVTCNMRFILLYCQIASHRVNEPLAHPSSCGSSIREFDFWLLWIKTLRTLLYLGSVPVSLRGGSAIRVSPAMCVRFGSSAASWAFPAVSPVSAIAVSVQWCVAVAVSRICPVARRAKILACDCWPFIYFPLRRAFLTG